MRYDAKLQPETEDVEGYTLHYVTLPGTNLRIGFVNIHDLLVVGIDEHILEQSVRTSRREIPAFSSDAHLRRSRERAMVPSEFDGYWNMAEISAYTNEYLGRAGQPHGRGDPRHRRAARAGLSGKRNERDEKERKARRGSTRQNVESIKAWLTERTRLAGLDVLGVSGRWDDMLALKFDLYFDRDKVDPKKGATYSCPAAANATLGFIPAGAIVYQWNNCLDLKASWDEISRKSRRRTRASRTRFTRSTRLRPFWI